MNSTSEVNNRNDRFGATSSKTHGPHRNAMNFFSWFSRPLLLFGLLLSIPAFYLLLGKDSAQLRLVGHGLYGLVALILMADGVRQWHLHRQQKRQHGKQLLDVVIIIGCLASVLPSGSQWRVVEWLFRLGLCAVILLRLSTLVLQHVKPSYLVQMTALALIMLTTAGAGVLLVRAQRCELCRRRLASIHHDSDGGVW